MTALIIRGPWCDSQIVEDRRLVRLLREAWPMLAPMTDTERGLRLLEAGIDKPELDELDRAVRRYQSSGAA